MRYTVDLQALLGQNRKHLANVILIIYVI